MEQAARRKLTSTQTRTLPLMRPIVQAPAAPASLRGDWPLIDPNVTLTLVVVTLTLVVVTLTLMVVALILVVVTLILVVVTFNLHMQAPECELFLECNSACRRSDSLSIKSSISLTLPLPLTLTLILTLTLRAELGWRYLLDVTPPPKRVRYPDRHSKIT